MNIWHTYDARGQAQKVTFEKCSFTNNKADDGAILVEGGKITMRECQVSNNEGVRLDPFFYFQFKITLFTHSVTLTYRVGPWSCSLIRQLKFTILVLLITLVLYIYTKDLRWLFRKIIMGETIMAMNIIVKEVGMTRETAVKCSQLPNVKLEAGPILHRLRYRLIRYSYPFRSLL